MEMYSQKRELAPGFWICPIINGLWQTAGGHGKNDYHKSRGLMKELYQAGFTTFDGADIWGPSEFLMGDLWTFLGEDASPHTVQMLTKWCPTPGKMSVELIKKNIGFSLIKMRTECLHLLQFHWSDYSSKEYINILNVIQELQKEKKILHLALTNFNTKFLKTVIDNNIPIVSNQVSYSIIDWRPEIQMVPFCQQHNIKLLTYGTLLGGFLSNKYLQTEKPENLSTSSQEKYIKFIDQWGDWSLFQHLLQTLDIIAKKHNSSISNVAIRYILDKPCVAGVIIGARLGYSSHIEDNKKVFSLKLDDQDRIEIDTIARKGNILPGDCGDENRNI